MRIFGIKITYPKREYLKKKQENPYYYYKKNNIDITTLPPATGQIRDIQLANLALLKELDYVCKQNGLTYWANFGTLLGTVRHKGFIPWDDDIDVSMMRKDYDKINDAFKNSSRNPDIYADYTIDRHKNCLIKVQHKKCPLLFVDIFPCDFANGDADYISREKLTAKLKKYRKKFVKDKSVTTAEQMKAKVVDFNKNILKTSEDKEGLVVYGLEYGYTEPIWVQPYETIFPVKPMKFEDFEIMSVNDPETYLKETMGDYMDYPKRIGVGHSALLNIEDDERKIIEELIK